MDASNQVVQGESKIFGVSGSPRRNGNSDIILKEIGKGASNHQIETDTTNLTTLNFKGCIGCEKCRKDKICTGIKDDMSLIYPKIIASQGLVLVSP